MKKVLSLFVVIAVMLSLAAVPAAAEGSYVYYDSAAKWTEDWTGSTNGNDNGLDMYGFTFGAWVNGTVSGGKATMANGNSASGTDYKWRAAALQNSGLDATADYTPAYRKLTMKLTIDRMTCGRRSIPWRGLEISTAEAIRTDLTAVGNYSAVESALQSYADSDLVLYINNSGRNQGTDSNMRIYPICKLNLATEYEIEYIFDNTKIYAVRVDGTYYTTSLDGTDFKSGLTTRTTTGLMAVENSSGTNNGELSAGASFTYSLFKYEGIEELPETSTDTDLDILMIGCSYGRDTMQDVSHFLDGLGEDFVIGRLFHGSTPIKTHYESAVGDVEYYSYTEALPGAVYGEGADVAGIKTVSAALALRDWDIVIIQTTTGVCALPDTYINESDVSYAQLMSEYIKARVPGAKIVWNMVWADPETVVGTATNLSDTIRNNFESNSIKMYNGITDAVSTHILPLVGTDIDVISPAGTAIQNAEGLGLTEAELYRDAVHLNTAAGCYIAGLTLVTSILDGVTVSDAVAAYSKSSVTSRLTEIQTAVSHALANPFKSIPTAKTIIENTPFNFRPEALSGKTEGQAKTLLADLINDAISDTGVTVSASDIAITGYSTSSDFTFTCTLSADMEAEDINVVVSDAFIVTPETAQGEIPAEGTLSFTFDMDMNASTLSPSTVLLKERIKLPEGSDAAYNNYEYAYSYDSAERKYTMTFGEGSLTPGNEYVIQFTTGVMAQSGVVLSTPVSFTYTTKWGDWYINDDFSRYPLNTQLAGGGAANTGMLPWQYASNIYGYLYPTKIVSVTSGSEERKAAYFKVNQSDDSLYAWGYRADYLPESRGYFTQQEVSFKFSAEGDNTYLGLFKNIFIVKKAADGKFYLHYVPYGTNMVINYTDFATRTVQPLAELSPDTDITLKFATYRDKNTTGNRGRYLYKLWINGALLTEYTQSVTSEGATMTAFPAAGLRMSSYASQFFEYSATTANKAGHNLIVAAAAANQKMEAWIYSVKYGPYSVVTCSPENGATDVDLGSDAVLTFAVPMKTSTFSGITVTDDANAAVSYNGTYDSTSNTYTLKFTSRPPANGYYKITVPETVQTSINLPINAAEFQFRFKSVPVDIAESGSISGSTLAKSVVIRNYTNDTISGYLILAAYCEGRLVGANSSYVTPVSGGGTANKSLSVSGDEIGDATKTITYKIMLWKDLDGLDPVTNAVSGTALR